VLKLLVVDDDPINLEAIRSVLTAQGYQVDTAAGGNEAIRKVSSNPYGYALAILDFRMGDKNGAETAKEILTITKYLFVLIHSADESREALQSAWEAGAVKFI
jgi:CheY-like chemotaxis protein